MVQAFDGDRQAKKQDREDIDQRAAYLSGGEPLEKVGLQRSSRNSAAWRERARRNTPIPEVGGGVDEARENPPSKVKCWGRRVGETGRSDEETGVCSRTVKDCPNRAEDEKSSIAESKPRRTGDRRASSNRATRNSGDTTGKAESRGMMMSCVGEGAPRIDRDDDDRSGTSLSPLRTTVEPRDYDEILSVSSASASVINHELSASSLPPMGTAATTATITEWVFDDVSLEDSGISASLASSSDRNAADCGNGCNEDNASDESGEGIGGGKRRGGSLSSRQRQGPASGFVCTRCEQRKRGNVQGDGGRIFWNAYVCVDPCDSRFTAVLPNVSRTAFMMFCCEYSLQLIYTQMSPKTGLRGEVCLV